MPPQIHADQPQAQPAATPEPGGRSAGLAVSRRSLLRGAAGVGAVGARRRGGRGRGRRGDPAGARGRRGRRDARRAGTARREPPSGEPLVVYLRDAATGEFEVFHGTRQVRVRNPRLVAQLLDGLATAQ